MPPGVLLTDMNYVTKLLDLTYYMITNILDNEIFRYFLFMIILVFAVKTTKELVCSIWS